MIPDREAAVCRQMIEDCSCTMLVLGRYYQFANLSQIHYPISTTRNPPPGPNLCIPILWPEKINEQLE